MTVTEGTLLDGQVRYAQPASGFRSGIEPVLLAAAIPARPGEMVLEGGAGAGAALLCLAARVPGLRGIGIERQPDLAALAAANARRNGFGGLHMLAADLAALPLAGRADHALANPPYHRGSGTASPDTARDLAKRAPDGLVGLWARALGGRLRYRGTLTLILPAGLLAETTMALAAAGCPIAALFPLWPREGMAAKLILVRGIKGGRAAPLVLPGLVLHQPDGRFTAAAEAVLRGGAPLSLG